MPHIKIYPPTKLPEKDVTDLLFNVWTQELEVYLSQDERFAAFMQGGNYATWLAADADHRYITQPVAPDAAADLPVRRTELRTFLSIIAKSCDIHHYNVVMRHSTSLQSIYDKLREDYDIQNKGIHFFHLLDLQYQPGTSAIGFYNQYRNLIITNLKKRGDQIEWQNVELAQDERLSPTFEDHILLTVLGLIDSRLPGHVRTHYHHHIGQDKCLMDFKTDILVKVPTFLQEIENKPSLGAINQLGEHLGAMRYQQDYRARGQPSRGQPFRGRANFRARSSYRGFATAPAGKQPHLSAPYCRLCHVTGQPDTVTRSHRIGDMECPKLSDTDKQYIWANRSTPRVNAVSAGNETEQLADQYGYDEEQLTNEDQEPDSVEQVRAPHSTQNNTPKLDKPNISPENSPSRTTAASMPRCNFITPVPSQILTVFTPSTEPFHIELDSNATVNYIKLEAAVHFKFKIKPNSQLSLLADGITKLPAIGEIHETFFRNDWQVQFNAIVVKNLHTQAIGGTVFLKNNNIQQDFGKNTINIQKKYTVSSTSPALILPIQPHNHLCTISTCKTLLPGQQISIPVPFTNNSIVSAEAFAYNKMSHWPEPQLCTVQDSTITLSNNTQQAVLLGKDVKTIQLRPTHLAEQQVSGIQKTLPKTDCHNSCSDIKFQSDQASPSAAATINMAHGKYVSVFDNDLTQGYNGAYGPHSCRLNWASDKRPTADQVRVVSYSHELKQLHQVVCDELTQQNVLGIPQESNVNVQFVCPSFLRRKPRAKNKPNHLLTKDDVRLVVNFSPVNDHLKNIPSIKTTPNDVLVALGRWKHIIIFDLYQGFFQNHMPPEDGKWLGVATPFGGIRFLRRSGQGLLGQSEELEELLAKILKEELQEGHCCKIADDIFVGGPTQEEAATVYTRILGKFHKANLKISGSKTHIFPDSADVLGWVWKKGGRLLPSPHRQLALKNTKQEDISTVKDLRSWTGLYKTLLIATPQLATIMDPFDKETASKDSREKVIWTPQLAQSFAIAKNHIDNVKELYLPSPHDQLLMVPDGSQKTPGIGHVLYAIVDGMRKPVRFHSVKLPENCKKWSPCEIEALAFATGIQAEMDIIKESFKPLLIAPDSSPVKDAVNLIKKGKFSASARMNSFITNINRIPIEVIHVSGKANLNAVGDMQSRHPSTCNSPLCSICTFVSNAIASAVNHNAKLAAIHDSSLYNTKTWASAQRDNIACRTALDHLRTGKQPSKKSGSVLTEIRRYCAIAKIGKDGCLVVPHTPSIVSHAQPDKIIIPTPLLPALLWHMHNSDNHPAKTQLRAKFDKMFYGILVQQQIDQLYLDCYQCKVTAALPKQCTTHTACTPVSHPGNYFHADIIKREKQKIFLLRDNFSSLVAATIIATEQAVDIKTAIILLTSTVRLASEITVRVDAATGFQALTKDQELQRLGITLEIGDSLNKNSNAVVDRACAEIEAEITKFQPQGGQISEATLAQAVLILNRKVRRQDKLTAIEIHYARSQTTQENLVLDDNQLRESQLNTRHLSKMPDVSPTINPGDTVVVAAKPQKHAIRDMYMVTACEKKSISMQKIAKPATPQLQLRPKVVHTTADLLHVVHKPTPLQCTRLPPLPQHRKPKQPASWSPFNPDFYTQHQEDDDLTDDPGPQQPNPVVRMQQWLHQQQQVAAAARQASQNAIQAYLPPPPPPPPCGGATSHKAGQNSKDSSTPSH